MSRSGGMSQLLKGIIIGIVLILAIIGTMSLLEKKTPDTSTQINSTLPAPVIEAPSISINPNNTKNTAVNETNTGRSYSQNQERPSDPENTTENSVDDAMKPVLEDERTAEEIENPTEPVQFGMLTLSAVNPDNKEQLKANYVVFDKDDVKVAESNNSESATYRLPAGQYKVVTTLTQPDIKTGRALPAVQKSQYLTIQADSTSNQVFELEPPSTIGILQVSAVSANAEDQAMRANFIVQKETGETIASRNSVTNSLFKLPAGSYKVTVRNGNNIDFRTIVVEAGESTEEVFKLQETFSQGTVLVRVFDARSSTPVLADISISSTDGKLIQELKSVSRTEISLAEGNYTVRVTGPNGQSNKNITVTPGQVVNEIFRFDAPQDTSSEQGTQITDNVTIKGVENQPITEPEQNSSSTTSVKILARNADNQQPLKSNIYIQTPSGQHLDKKTYVDSADFNLAPGVYKVTVRSTNRGNVVKTIRVYANQNITETFLLSRVGKSVVDDSVATPTLAPAKPVKVPEVIPNGFLNVVMLPADNQVVSRGGLNTHFIVATRAGRKVVELTGVPSANFKLDTGNYVVTAIHKNKRRSRNITIRENQNTKLNFNSGDFQNIKGVLRSRVIDESGRPLKADLTVTNMRGRVVARVAGVSEGIFNLEPRKHTINVNYQGLIGSEVVNVVAGETTIQTFTITPNRSADSNRNSQPSNDPRYLKERLNEQIQKQF